MCVLLPQCPGECCFWQWSWAGKWSCKISLLLGFQLFLINVDLHLTPKFKSFTGKSDFNPCVVETVHPDFFSDSDTPHTQTHLTLTLRKEESWRTPFSNIFCINDNSKNYQRSTVPFLPLIFPSVSRQWWKEPTDCWGKRYSLIKNFSTRSWWPKICKRYFLCLFGWIEFCF